MSPLAQFDHKFESLLHRFPKAGKNWPSSIMLSRAPVKSKVRRSCYEPFSLMLSLITVCARVAALLTRQQTWISDQAVHARLANCGAWLETLLAQLLHEKAARVSLQTGRSLKVVDATILTCPAARGTDYRLHLCESVVENEQKVSNCKFPPAMDHQRVS